MLEELKTFISVVDYKNFTKAAEHLNLSQPSVSTHIKNLENAFGVTLINRSVKQKTIFITESGHILYKRAKEIISLLEVTAAEVKNLSNAVQGSLKIGASLTIGENILPKFLGEFSSKYPDVDVEVMIENTSIISKHLKKLTLDIGLIEGSTSSSAFIQNYFLKDNLVLAMPYNSDLSSDLFSIDMIKNKSWIAREEGSGTREYLNLFLSNNNLIPKNMLVLGSNLSVLEAVKNNLGITILSNLVTSDSAARNKLTTIPLPENFTRSFSYIYPKYVSPSNITSIFLKELKEYAFKIQNT